jgi:hypothetical protein
MPLGGAPGCEAPPRAGGSWHIGYLPRVFAQRANLRPGAISPSAVYGNSLRKLGPGRPAKAAGWGTWILLAQIKHQQNQ